MKNQTTDKEYQAGLDAIDQQYAQHFGGAQHAIMQQARLETVTSEQTNMLGAINTTLNEIKDKDKKSAWDKALGGAKSTFKGAVSTVSLVLSPLTFTFKTAGKIGVISAGVATGMYAYDDNKDIMDIPGDMTNWALEHEETIQGGLMIVEDGVSYVYDKIKGVPSDGLNYLTDPTSGDVPTQVPNSPSDDFRQHSVPNMPNSPRSDVMGDGRTGISSQQQDLPAPPQPPEDALQVF